jgi:serine/threonine-protein kinase HipA
MFGYRLRSAQYQSVTVGRAELALDVHMHGERVGSLLRDGDGYELAYDLDATERMGVARARLSTTMPPRAEPYGPEVTRPWIEGLLPQGRRRLKLARELGLEPDDGYGLIGELGGDCPGAVTFLPAGEEPRRPDPDEFAWLEREELEDVLQTPLPQVLGGESPQRMRFALPGRRHKLALRRDEEGDRWAWPEPGAPSTHILKPDPPYRPGLAALELACAHAYRDVGLVVAHAEVVEIAGVECLLSKRFDRWQAGERVERLHQESLTQALGIPPGYAEERLVPGAPTLAEAAGLLRALGQGDAIDSLLVAAAADVWLGHTEPRGAGAALLHTGGEPSLAPFYDVAATEIYGDSRPRPALVGEKASPAPVLEELIQAVRQCGVEGQPGILRAIKLMEPLSKAMGAAAERAQEEDWYRRAIDEALQIALQRIQTFALREAKYLAPPGTDIPPWMQ